MIRRITSHLLIGLAVFVLTATLFIWTVDARVMNADVLSGELRKAGVMEEISSLLPEIVTVDSEEEANPEEIEQLRQAVSDVVTVDYVGSKLTSATDSIILFIREGEPDPVIDLSDFPQRVRNAGVEVDSELEREFANPIQINENGNLDNIASGYKVFSNFRYIGLVLFLLIMVAEWFVAERGKKLKRVSRVFLYAGLWYLLYWGLLILLPRLFGGVINSGVSNQDFDATNLANSIIEAVQGLFSSYFLGIAIVCLVVAVFLYVVRHFIHGDVVNSEKSTQKPNKK